MEENPVCPSCKSPVPAGSYFCFNCGKKLREKPPSTSIVQQIGVYSLSLLLPPLGLWPAFRYLRQSDITSRRIGMVALGLTVVSLLLAVWYTIYVINTASKIITSQMNIYQNLGR